MQLQLLARIWLCTMCAAKPDRCHSGSFEVLAYGEILPLRCHNRLCGVTTVYCARQGELHARDVHLEHFTDGWDICGVAGGLVIEDEEPAQAGVSSRRLLQGIPDLVLPSLTWQCQVQDIQECDV